MYNTIGTGTGRNHTGYDIKQCDVEITRYEAYATVSIDLGQVKPVKFRVHIYWINRHSKGDNKPKFSSTVTNVNDQCEQYIR
ncbi:hypothetical protein MASR1M107_05890 [Ignavibacteriales bacterium]